MQLEFITPLRLQKQKRLIGADSITSLDIHTALLRRLSLLLHCYGQGGEPLDIRALLEQARQQHGQGRLYWYDWRRYSTRQKRTMSLGGLLGSWRIYNLSAPWLALMHMGQYLHLGKEAAFGLGHYQLTAI